VSYTPWITRCPLRCLNEQTPGIVAPTLARISFAIYLLKFVGTSRWRRWILWSVVWSQVIFNIIQLVLIFAQCEHFAALWDPSVGGKCWSRKVQVYSGYFLGGISLCNRRSI
jgi:hypothetical protein